MRKPANRDRKLSLRRETLRRLSSLGRQDLVRVAGGGFLSDECADLSAPCDTLGKTSKYCPANE